jgi:vesicle coat complex subunit
MLKEYLKLEKNEIKRLLSKTHELTEIIVAKDTRIAALEAEVQRLREALEVIADTNVEWAQHIARVALNGDKPCKD